MITAAEQRTTSDTTTVAECDPFTLHLHDGMVRLDWSSGTAVDSGHATEVIEQVTLISKRWALPMLVHLNTMKFVSRGAMRIFADELDIAALAVVGPSPVDRTLSKFFIQVHKPSYPIQHFTTTETALSWLRGNREKLLT
jgi:hypothetical protein